MTFNALIASLALSVAAGAAFAENPVAPASLGEALNLPDWFGIVDPDPEAVLAASVRSLFDGAPPPLPDVDAERLLAAPLSSFVGVVFGQSNRRLEPRPAPPDADGRIIYDIGDNVDGAGFSGLEEMLRATGCHVVSRNQLRDGTAMAFQFSENKGDGYSLSFVIYDYVGPGQYEFSQSSLNYARYAPNALIGMVIATREIEGVATVVGQFDQSTTGGSLTVTQLPDGSMLGRFQILGVGSTDITESRKGATDQYVSSAFSGMFRTGSLDAPVVVEFVPLPMAGLGNAPPPPPPPSTPTQNVTVLSRSDCP